MMEKIFLGITFLGSFYWLFPAAIFCVIWLYLKNKKRESIFFALTMAISPLISNTLKNIIREPRPNINPLVMEKSFSFPSGHALNSMVFYLLLIYFLEIRNKYLAWGIILLIGISRIYLRVHYPTDVLGGYLIGYGIYRLGVFLEKKLWRNI